jgi:DNA-binding MarR family transcriptional regulator
MSKTKREGVWIPADIYNDTSLTWTQKLMLVEIASFCNNGRECYVSNQHLENFLQISNSQVVKVLRSLIERGLVNREFIVYEDGNRRLLSVADRVASTITPVVIEDTPLSASVITPPKREGLGGGSRLGLHTNTGTTNTVTKSKTKEATPKNVEQVIDYFSELELDSNEAFKFWDWYEQTGWKIKGGQKIKDWKATARNWKRRSNEHRNKETGFKPSNFNIQSLDRFLDQG